MINIDILLANPQTTNNVSGDKKSAASTNAVKKFYQTLMESANKRAQDAESRKKRKLAIIIQKLKAGIILTSDELQFLKNNAPAYFNQAMRQQRSYMTKNVGQHSIGKVSAIDPINIT